MVRNEWGNKPIIIKAVLGLYIGLCFIHLSFNNILEVSWSSGISLLMSAVGGFLIVYAVIVLIANIRVGKTYKGTKKEIKKNIDNAFKNDGNRQYK